MKEFKSFVEGLLADDNLSIKEIEHLRRYAGLLILECEDNFYLEKIYSLIKQIYADGEITKYEIEDHWSLSILKSSKLALASERAL